MKKLFAFMFVSAMLLLMVGCQSNNSQYTFSAQGVEVSFFTDASLSASFNNAEPTSDIMLFDSNKEDFKGSISISLTESDTSLEELCDLYFDYNGDMEQTVVNENLVFADFYSTVTETGVSINRYFFILLDNELQVVLCGTFFADNIQRSTVLSLAKSIQLKKSERISPYPTDYMQIIPKISILSSNEQVTEYCTIVDSWKNQEYEQPSYQELLKDKKVYQLSGYIDNIVFADGEHKSSVFTAKTDVSDSLFSEGASGFRISRYADTNNGECYVFINAKYGVSGKLTYIFKCKFQ